jgi:hypothetical protein
MTLSDVEIFLLGWNEYQRKRGIVLALSPIGEFDHAIIAPPTEAEIRQLIQDHTPRPKGPPYDVSEMKEYPVG